MKDMQTAEGKFQMHSSTSPPPPDNTIIIFHSEWKIRTAKT